MTLASRHHTQREIGHAQSRPLRMATHTNLVAIRIPEICTIVVLMILRPQPGRPVTLATLRKRLRVTPFDDFTRRGEERSHVSVPRVGRLAIERQSNEEERPLYSGTSPRCPRLARSTHANFKSDLS